MKHLKFLSFVLVVAVFFVFGYFLGRYSDRITKNASFNLKEQITLYQDDRKIGELYPGAVLTYAGGMAEGFDQAVLWMNYYERPNTSKYYDIASTHQVNPIFPSWNSMDVTPTSDYGALIDLFLNIAKFQGYFAQGGDEPANQMIIAYDDITDLERIPNIMKFGRLVRFVKKEHVNALTNGEHYWVMDFIHLNSTARIQMLDPTRNLLVCASFAIADGHWKIHSTEVKER